MKVFGSRSREPFIQAGAAETMAGVPSTPLSRDDFLAIARNHGFVTRPDSVQFPGWGMLLNGLHFYHVRVIRRWWTDDTAAAAELATRSAALLRALGSLAGTSGTVAFVIESAPPVVNVLIGATMSVTLLERIVRAQFPGSTLTLVNDAIPHQQDTCAVCLVGVPARLGRRESTSPDISALLRAGRGAGHWCYAVVARPVQETRIQDRLIELTSALESIELGLQVGVSANQNTASAHAKEALNALRTQLRSALREDGWDVASFVVADQGTAESLAATVRSCVGTADEQLEPLHAIACIKGDPGPRSSWETFMETERLGALAHPPTEDFPGYGLSGRLSFVTALPHESPARPIFLGRTLQDGEETGQELRLEADDLAQHVLIAGITGSTKTNSGIHLLHQAWHQHKIPFLVIEPAKTEFRQLLGTQAYPDLQCFTPGNETLSPFRLNPLDVEEGVPVQYHIDLLLAAFMAAFVLYPPMPHVLEVSLHEVYLDRQWDLAAGINRRGGGPRAMPTLRDLHEKVGAVTSRLGYDATVRGNIIAGLHARLGSLLAGGKGAMFLTRDSLPMDLLMKHPTVLEMEHLGNDEEKAFLLAVLLGRLVEYRRAEHERRLEDHERRINAGETRGPLPATLRHLLYIDEAHRLLARQVGATGADAAQSRSQAVETFTNLLAEVRAYGQGVIVVEQIPSKLAPEVVKNTGTKLVHRLVDAEERTLLAGNAGMADDQRNALVSLEKGQAILAAAGLLGPVQVTVPRQTGLLNVPVTQRRLREHARAKIFPSLVGPLRGLPDCIHCPLSAERRAALHARDGSVMGNPTLVAGLRRFLARAARGEDGLKGDIAVLLVSLAGLLQIGENSPVLLDASRCFLPRLAESLLEGKTDVYAVPFVQVENVVVAAREMIGAYLVGDEGTATIHREAYAKALELALESDFGPFAGCVDCRSRCHYRYEIAALLSNPTLAQQTRMAISATRSPSHAVRLLTALRAAVSQEAGESRHPTVENDQLFCYLTHALGQPEAALCPSEQIDALRRLRDLTANST